MLSIVPEDQLFSARAVLSSLRLLQQNQRLSRFHLKVNIRGKEILEEEASKGSEYVMCCCYHCFSRDVRAVRSDYSRKSGHCPALHYL